MGRWSRESKERWCTYLVDIVVVFDDHTNHVNLTIDQRQGPKEQP